MKTIISNASRAAAIYLYNIVIEISFFFRQKNPTIQQQKKYNA